MEVKIVLTKLESFRTWSKTFVCFVFTCQLSTIGRRNIENIKKLGVDLVEFSPNPVVRKKLNYIGLTVVGDIAWLDTLEFLLFQ